MTVMNALQPKALLAAALTLALACGDDGTGPALPGIRLVAGHEMTDTALAVPVQGLVVEVLDEEGAALSGAVVRFESLMLQTSPAGWSQPSMYVGSVASLGFGQFVADTTDASGRATVRIRYGSIAGPGGIVITVPTLGVQDTATYTILPGAATSVAAEPQDTAIYVGGSYPLRAVAVDQHGNARDDAVSMTVAAVDGTITVEDGVVTGTAIGRGTIILDNGTTADTAWVSVVPSGTLAAAANNTIVVFNLDGSEYRELAPPDSHPEAGGIFWMPSGESLIFFRNPEYTDGQRLMQIDLSGNVTRLTQDQDSLQAEMWAQPSRDGGWVYISGTSDWRSSIWRVHADGTGLERVPGFPGPDGYNDLMPSLSPDGNRLVYLRFLGPESILRIFDLQTMVVDSVDVLGHSPRWSPTDDRIAYLVPDRAHGTIFTMRADASEQQAVSQAGRTYGHGLDWSPDSEWIVSTAVDSSRIEIVQAQSGLTLPLGYTRGFRFPAWKPND